MIEPHLSAPPAGPLRTCIVTGEEGTPERMIRFVVGPQGEVVPDLARKLPGRGLWVRAGRAGRAVSGFVKVEQMIGRGRAGLLIVAAGADGDGMAKLAATGLPLERLGDAASLGGVFGREQAVYVAVAHDDRSGQFIQRIAGGAARWRGYRLNGAG